MATSSIECSVIDIFRSRICEDGTTWAAVKVYIPNDQRTPVLATSATASTRTTTDTCTSTATAGATVRLPYIFHLTGIIPNGLTPKDRLKCVGTIVEKEPWDPEFKASEITLVKPMGVSAVRDSLAELVGIGRMNADRAVCGYKDEIDIIDAMVRDPAKLRFRIGHADADRLIGMLTAKWGSHAATLFLHSLGIRSADIKKICSAFMNVNIEETIRKNPFEAISAVGFKICDTMREALGFPLDMAERLDAGVVWLAEKKCYERGHCALNYESLLVESASSLQMDENSILTAISRLLAAGKLIETILLCERLLFPKRFWDAEQDVIEKFALILAVSSDELKIGIDANFKPDDVQKRALEIISQSKISVLTGGPGTGKTTLIKCVLDSAISAEQKVVLCAPTGLAARRMKDACKYDASTIHRALGSTVKVPIETADIVIVDEMSMVGIELFRNLMCRVKAGARIILVGDADQLPSIEPGNVLSDIITSGIVPVSRLITIYRQGSGSLLCENIMRINRGEMPKEIPGNNEFAMRFFDQHSVITEATKVCTKILMQNPMDDKLFDIQIIVPTKAGSLGAEGLNRELRAVFIDVPAELKANAKFVSHDKVIQCENDYDRDVVNGEIGRVTEICANGNYMVQFSDRKISYTYKEADQLKLAYAITVHKSQGSEFQYLIITLVDAHGPLLNRRLLYTAFSRGKKKVVLICNKSALERALANTKNDVRYTGLAPGLKNRLYLSERSIAVATTTTIPATIPTTVSATTTVTVTIPATVAVAKT
jgi:exodeoxyribonuclease V alpha subunit